VAPSASFLVAPKELLVPGSRASPLASRWLAPVLCALTMAYIVVHSAFGIGRGETYPPGSMDYVCLFASGDTWLHGEDPYAEGTLHAHASERDVPELCLGRLYCVLAYPPHTSAIFCPLSSLPWNASRIVFLLLNLAAAVTVMWVVSRLIRNHAPGVRPWVLAIVLPLSIGPFLADTEIHYGQTTLIAVAAFMLFLWFYERDAWLPAGIALAVAAVKPNLVFLPCLMLFFRPRWRIVATAIVVGLLMSLPAILLRGGPGVFLEWIEGMRFYKSVAENQAGSPRSFGLAVLASGLGLDLALRAQVLLALAVTVACGILWRSGRVSSAVLLALVPLSLFLGGGHDVDVLTLGPALALLVARADTTLPRTPFLAVLAALGLAWMTVQPSWLRLGALLGHDLRVWSELFVLAVVVLCARAFRTRAGAPGTTAA
jgi:hypothetical protein